MGNRTRIAPVAPPTGSIALANRGGLTRIPNTFRWVIDWLRAGYPDGAPSTGYSPLLALNGPLALTPGQTGLIIDERRGVASDTTDIEVAITKATDRLPTQTQVRAISQALQQHTRHQ
jgi:hypothetical protein